MSCHLVIPNTFIACGEGDNYCSDECMLRAALVPFAKAAEDHGVRKPSPEDLWVSLGVPSSAWVRARAVLKGS